MQMYGFVIQMYGFVMQIYGFVIQMCGFVMLEPHNRMNIRTLSKATTAIKHVA